MARWPLTRLNLVSALSRPATHRRRRMDERTTFLRFLRVFVRLYLPPVGTKPTGIL